MKRKIVVIMISFGCVLMTGCDRNPLKKTSTLANEGLLPGVHAEFIIYDDTLKTGGNLFMFPGGENQTVDLKYRDRPYSGKKAIVYTWTGEAVHDSSLGIDRHDFAGMVFSISQGSSDFDAAVPLDISLGNYTKASFWVRGSLSANTTVKFEVVDDGDTSTDAPQITVSSLTNSWEQKEITGISTADLSSVKEFFKVTFIYTQPTGTTTNGGGGTIYIDDIKLEQ